MKRGSIAARGSYLFRCETAYGVVMVSVIGETDGMCKVCVIGIV